MTFSSSDNQSHGQLMDAIYRKQRHIYDATRKYYLLGRDHLIDHLDPPSGGSVLEIACGTGRNLVQIAKKYPDVQLYGVDISSEMLLSAKAAMDRNGLSDRVRLAEANACDMDLNTLFGISSVDRVILSYSLSMIPDWIGALKQAVDLGGQLHIVDFGNQTGLPSGFRSLLHAWLAKFHVTPRVELECEMLKHTKEKGLNLDFKSLYRDYARYGVIS